MKMFYRGFVRRYFRVSLSNFRSLAELFHKFFKGWGGMTQHTRQWFDGNFYSTVLRHVWGTQIASYTHYDASNG